MDKIDNFLMGLANGEKDNFTLPQELDDKIENILDNLEEKKCKAKWYKNKQLIVMAATIAFACLIGIKPLLSKDIADESKTMKNDIAQSRDFNFSIGIDDDVAAQLITESLDVKSIAIEKLSIDNKEQATLTNKANEEIIEDKDKIMQLMGCIKDTKFTPAIAESIEDWDCEIIFNTNTEYSFKIKNNLVSINNTFYIIDNESKARLVKNIGELK